MTRYRSLLLLLIVFGVFLSHTLLGQESTPRSSSPTSEQIDNADTKSQASLSARALDLEKIDWENLDLESPLGKKAISQLQEKARTLYSQGEREKALKVVEQLEKLVPGHPTAVLIRNLLQNPPSVSPSNERSAFLRKKLGLPPLPPQSTRFPPTPTPKPTVKETPIPQSQTPSPDSEIASTQGGSPNAVESPFSQDPESPRSSQLTLPFTNTSGKQTSSQAPPRSSESSEAAPGSSIQGSTFSQNKRMLLVIGFFGGVFLVLFVGSRIVKRFGDSSDEFETDLAPASVPTQPPPTPIGVSERTSIRPSAPENERLSERADSEIQVSKSAMASEKDPVPPGEEKSGPQSSFEDVPEFSAPSQKTDQTASLSQAPIPSSQPPERPPVSEKLASPEDPPSSARFSPPKKPLSSVRFPAPGKPPGSQGFSALKKPPSAMGVLSPSLQPSSSEEISTAETPSLITAGSSNESFVSRSPAPEDFELEIQESQDSTFLPNVTAASIADMISGKSSSEPLSSTSLAPSDSEDPKKADTSLILPKTEDPQKADSQKDADPAAPPTFATLSDTPLYDVFDWPEIDGPYEKMLTTEIPSNSGGKDATSSVQSGGSSGSSQSTTPPPPTQRPPSKSEPQNPTMALSSSPEHGEVSEKYPDESEEIGESSSVEIPDIFYADRAENEDGTGETEQQNHEDTSAPTVSAISPGIDHFAATVQIPRLKSAQQLDEDKDFFEASESLDPIEFKDMKSQEAHLEDAPSDSSEEPKESLRFKREFDRVMFSSEEGPETVEGSEPPDLDVLPDQEKGASPNRFSEPSAQTEKEPPELVAETEKASSELISETEQTPSEPAVQTKEEVSLEPTAAVQDSHGDFVVLDDNHEIESGSQVEEDPDENAVDEPVDLSGNFMVLEEEAETGISRDATSPKGEPWKEGKTEDFSSLNSGLEDNKKTPNSSVEAPIEALSPNRSEEPNEMLEPESARPGDSDFTEEKPSPKSLTRWQQALYQGQRQLGLAAYTSKDWKQAAHFFEEALALNPNDQELKTKLKESQEHMSEPPSA